MGGWDIKLTVLFVCLSVWVSVWDISHSKQIWLKLYTWTEVCPSHFILDFGGYRPSCLTRGARMWFYSLPFISFIRWRLPLATRAHGGHTLVLCSFGFRLLHMLDMVDLMLDMVDLMLDMVDLMLLMAVVKFDL